MVVEGSECSYERPTWRIPVVMELFCILNVNTYSTVLQDDNFGWNRVNGTGDLLFLKTSWESTMISKSLIKNMKLISYFVFVGTSGNICISICKCINDLPNIFRRIHFNFSEIKYSNPCQCKDYLCWTYLPWFDILLNLKLFMYYFQMLNNKNSCFWKHGAECLKARAWGGVQTDSFEYYHI